VGGGPSVRARGAGPFALADHGDAALAAAIATPRDDGAEVIGVVTGVADDASVDALAASRRHSAERDPMTGPVAMRLGVG
jgi:hypothetical protein